MVKLRRRRPWIRDCEVAGRFLPDLLIVDDWGKLLGDSAVVTPILDRLLHHGHIHGFFRRGRSVGRGSYVRK
jgi:hypothetical protein